MVHPLFAILWISVYAALIFVVEKFVPIFSFRLLAIGLLTTALWPLAFVIEANAIVVGGLLPASMFMLFPPSRDLRYLAPVETINISSWLFLGFLGGCALGAAIEWIRRKKRRAA